MSKHICIRCGQCCIGVGRTFWKVGDFKNYPELETLATLTESVDGGLPCQMLQMKDGVASCKIQTDYGWKAKPEVCRTFPDDECHHNKGTFKNKRICLLEAG